MRTTIFILFLVMGLIDIVKAQDTALAKVDTLKALTVQGSKPFIQYKAGKVVVNVAESPMAAGGNAADVIRHIPGVDGLQYHGRTILVLIDGRSTGLKGADLQTILDGMAAGTIDRVELIATPSARYDADGGVVLNIITVKVKKPGVNGTLTSGVGAGRYMKVSEGGTLNYRTGKMNVYAGYDYAHGKPFTESYSQRRVDTVGTIYENTSSTRISNNHSFRGGMDYSFDSRRSAGVLLKGMYNVRSVRSATHSVLSRGDGLDTNSDLRMSGRSTYFIPSVNAWYKQVLDSTGRELNVNVDYLHYTKRYNEAFTADPVVLRDQSPAGNTIVSVSADYVHPTKIGRFEAGVKNSFTRTDNNILWEYADKGNWLLDAGKTNHFIYEERIKAGYLNYSGNWKKWGLTLGLRAEHTHSSGESVTLDRVDKRDYLSWFPNAGLQYSLTADHQFNFSYRRGIERFGFDVVNPFVRYISQYSYSQGNPNIRPSTSQNFDISYSWKGELNVSMSYQHYLDAPGTVFFKSDTGNAVISSETNLGSADQFQTEVSYSKALLNGKWQMSNSVGALYARYVTAVDSRGPGSRWTAMISTDNVFSLTKGWKAQLNAMYYSPFLFGVYSFRSRFAVDMGVSRTVLHDKGKLSLNVSDVFNTLVSKYDVHSYDISSYNRQKTESQVVRLVFSYKFGGKPARNGASHRSGIEDLRGRMGGN